MSPALPAAVLQKRLHRGAHEASAFDAVILFSGHGGGGLRGDLEGR